MQRIIARIVVFLCALTLVGVYSFRTTANPQTYTDIRNDSVGYKCVYNSTNCNNSMFPRAWGYTLTGSYFCKYQLATGNIYDLVEGPYGYTCTDVYNGCCTMPADDTCDNHPDGGTCPAHYIYTY